VRESTYLPLPGDGELMAEPGSALHRELASWLHANRTHLAELSLEAHAARSPREVERHREALLQSVELRVDRLRAAALTGSPDLLVDNVAWTAVPILVGGHPFNLVSSLWRIVGVNGTTNSSIDAVRLGGVLIEGRMDPEHDLS
jgi:hypothetical protein